MTSKHLKKSNELFAQNGGNFLKPLNIIKQKNNDRVVIIYDSDWNPHNDIQVSASLTARLIIFNTRGRTDPSERLSARDTVKHSWFEGLSLKMLRKRQIKAPWIPKGGEGEKAELRRKRECL